jgi:hypothetical protein
MGRELARRFELEALPCRDRLYRVALVLTRSRADLHGSCYARAAAGTRRVSRAGARAGSAGAACAGAAGRRRTHA